MHIITGLAVAGLAKLYAQQRDNTGIPRFHTGPLRVSHAIDGRLRLLAPSLCGVDKEQLGWLKTLKNLAGVNNAEVNTVTGSILVHYQHGAVEPLMIFEAVARLLGVEEELHHPPAPALLRELRNLGDSANRVVYDTTGGVADLRTVLLVGLAVMGTKKVLESGWAAFPAGFTLLWWALHGVSRNGTGAL